MKLASWLVRSLVNVSYEGGGDECRSLCIIYYLNSNWIGASHVLLLLVCMDGAVVRWSLATCSSGSLASRGEWIPATIYNNCRGTSGESVSQL